MLSGIELGHPKFYYSMKVHTKEPSLIGINLLIYLKFQLYKFLFIYSQLMNSFSYY